MSGVLGASGLDAASVGVDQGRWVDGAARPEQLKGHLVSLETALYVLVVLQRGF